MIPYTENKPFIWLISMGTILAVLFSHLQAVKAFGRQTLSPDCENTGWYPIEFGLKDHHIFWFDGYYYLVSIYVPYDDRFAYARTKDFCEWEDFSPIMSERIPGEWDEYAIWAPYVYQEDGVFYMYYTGLNGGYVQSIMLATTENPADPDSWERQGMVFQPNHAGMLWGLENWSDCRDPTVIKVREKYYMYYSGMDETGGIVGLASADSPRGPWVDWGAVMDPLPGIIPESPTIVLANGSYYLFYHLPGMGEYYRMGNSPAGPWKDALPFSPGWAHEIWQDIEGAWFTSYLTSQEVTISPLIWDHLFQPARPVIGDEVHHLMIPMIVH